MSQNTSLIGILDDGSDRVSWMPRSTATTVLQPQNATARIDVRAYYPSGVPVRVASLAGWAAKLAVVSNADPCQVIPELTKVGALVEPDPQHNLLRFDFAARDFRGRPLGRYIFDVWLSTTTERWQLVAPSALVITAGLLRS